MNKLLIKITGKDVVRFIKNLIKMHINFYDINYINNSVYIKINIEDYKKIKLIKTLYKIEIVEYYGILRIRYFIKKYIIFLIAISISFIMFLLLTNIIFEIKINHTNKELVELILSELKENKIDKYKFVVNYKKKELIKNKIINKYRDKIEWLEIKRIGTTYEILVEERLINNNKDDNIPRNIIASKNAIITKINSSSGEVVGKVDHYVKKGDILISGIIHKKEDVVGYVKADGKVLGETWYNVTVELPYHSYNSKSTGNKDYYLNIKIFNKNINLFSKKYKNIDTKEIFKIRNSLLPISISINKDIELEVDDNLYTYDNIIAASSDIARDALYKKLGKNISIKYEKGLKYEEENSKIIVVMFYKIIEDITDYEVITNSDEEIG